MGDFNSKRGDEKIDSITIETYGLGITNAETLKYHLQSKYLFCMIPYIKKLKIDMYHIISNNKCIITDISVINKVNTGSDPKFLRVM